jgi:predicted SprT family Zn-dependent metalloprotease
MDFAAAERLAKDLLRAHGCEAVPLQWCNSVVRFGQIAYVKGAVVPTRVEVIQGRQVELKNFMYSLRRLTLSKTLVEANEAHVVRNTILHEIAHLLDVKQRGYTRHDQQWFDIAASLGCDAKVHFDASDTVIPKPARHYNYVAKCPTCRKEYHSYVLWKEPGRHCVVCLDRHPRQPHRSALAQRRVDADDKLTARKAAKAAASRRCRAKQRVTTA